MTHICASELTIIGSDNGLSPARRQAIIWNNAGLLLIEPLGTKLSEFSIGIQTFSFKKMHLNMSSAKWRPFCLGLNVLIQYKICGNAGYYWLSKLSYHDRNSSSREGYSIHPRIFTYSMYFPFYGWIIIPLWIHVKYLPIFFKVN